ncbi:Ferredoxin subunit of nitrite reductase or a ring-hydroxylating dioxygenase [Rhizobiales bacterium GAS188]|nr:Ferredoxin subunit of nitrite reductase or a ring-hydroxylating dioxygenase [Rhizobiales bacterium GAS188]
MSAKFERAGTLTELKDKGRLVLRGPHRPILVVNDRDHLYAFDNRCPHMGFPLDRGSVEDGILTCHWHHARFDLASGCTFDLWADDVPTCPVEVRGGEVWVKAEFGPSEPAAYWRQRLESGMAHNLGLTIAKAVQGQLAAGVAPLEILRQAAIFGAKHLDGWGTGMTILTALGNLFDILPDEEIALALFHGIARVAADCDGAAPHRRRAALASRPDQHTLKRWLRRWAAVRHHEAAERTILTAISAGARPAALADLLLAAETDRVFADSGHSLDFINKAFECLDLIGWQNAAELLPLVIGQMVAARGADESTQWRQPADLVALCERAATGLPALFAAGRGPVGRDRGPWLKHTELAGLLLSDDPDAIIAALETAISEGAAFADLGRSLSYAAALRVARFGTANEHGDWETAHHVFTYCNAVHQGLKRIGSDPEPAADCVASARAVFHGALAIYLTRYLNVPPARLPGEADDRAQDLPSTVEDIRAALLEAFDRQHRVEDAARLVARHLTLGHNPQSIIATLAHALLREDAGFHAYQILEAGVRQFREWEEPEPRRHILIAVARYLAAHAPTERASLQTADIATRLSRGDQLHEDS